MYMISEAVDERTYICVLTKWLICRMCIANEYKEYDRSLFPVAELFAFLRFIGIDTKYAQKAYKYVQEYEPYGCYISGNPKAPWHEDYFVLASGSLEAWEEEENRLLSKLKEKWWK